MNAIKKNIISSFVAIITWCCITQTGAYPQEQRLPEHIAYDIKAERIKFTNDSAKITWKMNPNFNGEFVVGRGQGEFKNIDDVLKAKLVGVFYPTQDGFLIDRDLQPGKSYYYIILSKEHLLKREIEIIQGVNCTSTPIIISTEPGIVTNISAELKKDSSVVIKWKNPKGDNLKFCLYRSKSLISSPAELEVAEKIATTDNNEFMDNNIPEYGSFFYAVTVVDKNNIEYFSPEPDKNFTTKGVYRKGKTLSTPLNVAAFLTDNNSVIIKWEKSKSRTDKELSGYEIYRSDEVINSLLKLRFATLIKIVDAETITYRDENPGPGKYFYAVFSRYNDGTVDINFEDESSYTKTPIIINLPFKITAMTHDIIDDKLVLKWNYVGNSGIEEVEIFRSKIIPADSSKIMRDDIIGTENIKAGKFIISFPEKGTYFYGVLPKDSTKITEIVPEINATKVINTENNHSKIEELEKTKEYNKSKTIDNKKEDNESSPKGDRNLLELSKSDKLESIIRNLFYKGKYELAKRELKKFMDLSTDPLSRGKARLFLARCYIETGDYKKALLLLNNDEVKNNYPEDFRFWFDFATSKLK